MDSGLFTFFLPIALAIMMTGLGLELTPKDFLRIQYYPKAIFLALFAQLIILVFIAFFLTKSVVAFIIIKHWARWGVSGAL